ncbi:hypothetical protein QYE76_013402 [Lolium multiflorum]|uniref:Transposase (putative) gypsy type domain-containing protein n=1 Tax=Lolium multiflorum TaxID=4521 RepID=A0AAD8U304_LOLMU|nr:hypothetical protein QYE76_013402 [Lolium multiflorum]
MAAKVQETENKKASKARNREGERGQWWPCETTDTELRELQNEGMISAHWSFIRDTVVPKPGAGEVVMTKAWVERGLSLPCSEFFLSILNTYGLQPHNICPNSYLLLSNFATLCEGHLGIRPDVKLWQFFFRVKKETKHKAMLNCGSMTFMLRPSRMYPPHDSHESVRYWNAGWFYEKNVSVPEIHDGLPKFNNEPPEELASWSFIPSLSLTPILEKAARRISWLVHDGLTGTQLTQLVHPADPATTEQQALHYELHKNIALQRRVTLGQAENIRTLKNENAELNKQLADAQEPLGYSERRRNKFPRDDVLSLAGDDCKDLISASRKICHNFSLKKSRTCGLRKLVKRMDILPELVTDLQASSARGAAAMTLTMCLAHNPEMDLDRVTTGVPPTADVGALLDAVSGYDTRIARRIRHDEFYDKEVLL